MPRVSPPPSFAELLDSHLDKLGSAVATSSYQEALTRSQRKHRHWHKARYIAKSTDVDPRVLWLGIKLGRLSSRQHLPLTGEHDARLWYIPADPIQREITRTDLELGGRITINTDDTFTEAERDRFVVGSLMEEAIASSKLEGASTMHQVAKDMLRRNREPRDKHERMIFNNYRALQHIRETNRQPLDEDYLIELQRLLTEGTLEREDEVGRLRRDDEQIVVADAYGTVRHDPPHASTLAKRLRQLCEFANQEPTRAEPFVHPLIRAAALHFQLTYDHPFCDGNGRTARVLFYWMMLRSGYWMFEFLPISRLIIESPGQYQRAFQEVETDEFDLTYFLMYHARLIARARSDLAEYLARQRSEFVRAREQYSNAEINDRQRSFLLKLSTDPGRQWTIAEYQSLQGVTNPTARSDLLHLEELGYLDKRKVGKKFVFTPSADPPD